jgi:hypothetical protein
MSRLNITIVTLLLIFGIPYYWFMLDNSAPPAKAHPIEIAQLRSLAKAGRKTAPVAIRFERVASQTVMGNRIAAGMGLRAIRLHTFAYMLDYGEGAPVLIGTGLTRADARRFDHQSFGEKAQARINMALTGARAVVPLALTPEQLGGLRKLEEAGQAKALDDDFARQQEADRKGAPHRVAPGVAIIPTPQFQQGSRMVYARLANGREYLFAGELAPTYRNWHDLRLPARFVTDMGRREDRQAILSWLMTIRALKQQAPDLVVVPGHKIPKHSGMRLYFDDSANILH